MTAVGRGGIVRAGRGEERTVRQISYPKVQFQNAPRHLSVPESIYSAQPQQVGGGQVREDVDTPHFIRQHVLEFPRVYSEWSKTLIEVE